MFKNGSHMSLKRAWPILGPNTIHNMYILRCGSY
ncbi:unnamed protein product [Arabidopsis halleri]